MLPLAVALLLSAAPTMPPRALAIQGARELPPIQVGPHVFRRRLLANGLRAVAVQDEGERVSIFVVLGAGNRQETPETTGLAHYVEHAMFSGTPAVGVDELERRVESWGGEANAFTRDDYTLYYDDGVPVEHLGDVLAMEADRLRHLDFDAAHVLHERERLEVEEAKTFQPSEGREEELEAAVFRVHPYRAGLRDARGHTRAPELAVSAARDFYERYYHPNRACVVVVGPIDPGAALDAIERAYGALPAGPPIEATPVEPWVEAPRTERIPSSLPRDRVELCWLVPELGDPARPALQLLARWLGREELAGGAPVEASSGGRVDRDLFRVAASGDGALEGLRALVERTRNEPIGADALRDLAKLERDAFAGRPLRARPYFSLAGTFGTYEVFGKAELVAEHARAIDALTPEDLLAAARRWLAPERCVTVVFEGTGAPVAPLPTETGALATAAREAAQSGDVERALAAYTALLAKKPNKMNTVIYLAERGGLRMDARDFDGAIADFEQALDVVDYPAVRDLLEEAHARKAAAMRGEFDGSGAAEPAKDEPKAPADASSSDDPDAQTKRDLLAEVEATKRELEEWRGLRFVAPVVPDFVAPGSDELEDDKHGGWYEPASGRLVVVLGKSNGFTRGAQLHELFHALQDQTWDLSVLDDEASATSDSARALQGLIEGEAMLAVSELMHYDFEQHAQIPATGEVERARFEKLFQYGTGLRFVRALRERSGGGWRAVNRAWGSPPRTSAELYHPERYPAPVPEALDELALPELGEGAVVRAEDALGEFELRWLLVAEESTRALADDLGAALVSDRRAELDLDGGAHRERWDLRFDTEAHARRFVDDARAAYERDGWTAERAGRDARLWR